ncbi:hypothetical protein, partial [Listeria monocytogenes]|uniref:hypothetical protein n=1 Tax=Listeria monocytogenes TaxID=1639 RepID=UPI001A93765C
PVDTPVVMVGRYAGVAIGMNETPEPEVPAGYFSRPYASSAPALLREFSANIVQTACGASAGGRKVFLVRPIPEIGKDV